MHIPSDIRSWAEIDLAAIRHNLGVAREKIGADAGIVAIIKANAYGHGAVEVARAISDLCAGFGVANLDEALPLKTFGRDIFLLGPCTPGERKAAGEAGVIVTVSNVEEAAAYGSTRLNFKVDTGMGRIGCWQDEALDELRKIVALPGVRLHSISTHLPVPDEDEAFTSTQLAEFQKLATEFRALAPGVKIHSLNSSGVLGFPQYANDLVRPGLMIYGSAYPEKFQPLLKPALTWKTRIILLRDVGAGRSISYGRTFITEKPMRLASLPVGYADGFPRQLSGRGAQVLIGGKRCDVLGRVTMDQIVVDVTHLPETQVGDEAVLIGSQGDETILAREMAEKAGTITWDIFTGIKNRVKRFYAQPGVELPPALPAILTINPAFASREKPFVSSLGQPFVPVEGYPALFCIWPVRVSDFAVYSRENSLEMPTCDFAQGPDHPVVNVNWKEAMAFCRWLTKRDTDLGLIQQTHAYRLPEDREWSAAAKIIGEGGRTPAERSGKRQEHPWGEGYPPPRGAGNYHPSLGVDDFAETSPVGSFAPNAFGLYDLGGNVWEWCLDNYDHHSDLRVLRGASCFNDDDEYLLSSYRHKTAPDNRRNNIGLRLVLAAKSKEPWF